jgi:phosphonatase-like hydrolase
MVNDFLFGFHILKNKVEGIMILAVQIMPVFYHFIKLYQLRLKFGPSHISWLKQKSMTPGLIVFDLAGTTVFDDRFVHKVLRQTLSTHDVDISLDDANEVMGIPKPVAIEQLLLKRYLGKRPISEAWILAIHEQFAAEMVSFYRNDEAVRENDGVSETFERLKSAGIRIAVDTGFNREITNPLLERLGWLKSQLVDWSVTSDEVPRGRPFPDMVFKAMALAGITEPARVAKVGDTPSDLGEGTSARCGWVIGVTNGAFTHEQLKREPHTHLIPAVPDVLAVLKVKSFA